MRRNKRRNTIILISLLVLGLSIGFAALATTLKINGNATLFGGKWDIHWDNVGNVSKSDTTVLNTPAEIDSSDNKQVNFAVTFNQPGDYYEFQVDAVNNGSLDALITLYTTTVNGEELSDLPDYVVLSTTYADGSPISEGDTLAKKSGDTPTTKRYKVKIEYSREIDPDELNNMSNNGETYEFAINLVYSQKGTPVGYTPESFATDSWKTIAYAVRHNNTSVYNVGDTKTITLHMDFDDDGEAEDKDFVVRIANKTTPSACNDNNFSKTACGFVIEFANNIVVYPMNDPQASLGGWKDSQLREYLEGTIYNALPSDLKKEIRSTKVISGHGSVDSDNFITKDKLYLLNTIEVWGEDTYGFDSSSDATRQLEYYSNNNVTISNPDLSVKTYIDPPTTASNYNYTWLRSAMVYADGYFMAVSDTGSNATQNSTSIYGISPAFKLN